MNSQTSLQIKDCQNRPDDMTVNEWCLQNNITKANYYYRLKCVRQACLDSMESNSAFVEFPSPEMKSSNKITASSDTVAIIRGANGLSIEIHENASADFLRKLIEACKYTQ